MSRNDLVSRLFRCGYHRLTLMFRERGEWRKVSVRRLVLSVEDDTAAYALIRHAFRDIGSELELERTLDGKDALDFLNRSGRYKDAPKPSLILLDMNLPRMTGPELLAAMQANESFRDIPVVVFSSSKLDADRAKCLALGASEFIVKPNTYDEFVTAVKSACAFASTA
jgi:CheY-like chemotaxis protein